MRSLKSSFCTWLLLSSLILQCYIFVILQRSGSEVRLPDASQSRSETPNLGVSGTPTTSATAIGSNESRNCTVPNNWLYPLCEYKVKWLRGLWTTNKACFIDRHKMDPKDDCSILIFLSEVEAWCPILPWRRHLYPAIKDLHKNEKALVRRDLDELFRKMNDSKYQWMRDRINRLWPDWRKAAMYLEKANPTVKNRQVQHIFLYMGTYSYEKDWLSRAYKGVPLGEMVQWSDLIASLYVLGHQLTIASDIPVMTSLLNATADKGCARQMRKKEFDLVYTDYVGAAIIRSELGPTASHYRCRLRILDSFGTDPEFNYAEYKGRENTFWGGADVHVRQMMTMFPHSPDNLFLGFVVDKAVTTVTMNEFPPLWRVGGKPIGLVYGKDAMYFQGRREYIEILSKYLEIHATVNNQTQGAQDAIKRFVPDVVINHGILKGGDLQALLKITKVFIGLGFPYEGPAPLEAISQGCVFLNPKLIPPKSRHNADFFKGKPTSREVCPYLHLF